jgi:RimJ/RimL family protein N-acetyltransferase
MEIRAIREDDAEAFLRLRQQLDRETAFMLFEPDERTTSVEEQRHEIAAVLASPNSMVLVAEDGERLIGFISAHGGRLRRIKHVGHIVIGIARAHTGQSLGTSLFEAMEPWAREAGLRRLELTVMTHNRAGLALYTKMGFLVEGLKRHALCVDETWVDEYHMGKLLN